MSRARSVNWLYGNQMTPALYSLKFCRRILRTLLGFGECRLGFKEFSAMNGFSSCGAVCKTPLFVSLITIAILMVGLSEARAYDKYSDCEDCHGDFLANPYVSLANDSSWGDSLHNVHRNEMLNSDCNVCHEGDYGSVSMDSSTGGSGMAPISCVGCHGRDEDAGNDSVSEGRGAGLRQHHFTAGVESCANCHIDSNPSGCRTEPGDNHQVCSPDGRNHPAIPVTPSAVG